MEGAASASLVALQTGHPRMRRTPPATQRGQRSLLRRANRRAAFDVAEVRDLKARTLAQPRPLVHDDHGILARADGSSGSNPLVAFVGTGRSTTSRVRTDAISLPVISGRH